ncbi:hypothetical protein [Legionella shakespearei]|uniref:Uncharacterized protein n=1 Tax=Legionella shakespearei DSM 23087 TaxID=1122169 RepID=A0A0W0YZN5_9GAMM|nr:hypothetical protein [Legionella shakespearei]KTD62322.1 hypothetical protein Lsha_1022 [Legionella shakespearei DSM 23087]
MTQNTPGLSHWFVKDDYRAKAQIKYELKHLESRLHQYLDVHSELVYCPDEVDSLCRTLASRYMDYLKLIHAPGNVDFIELSEQVKTMSWHERHSLIVCLKQQLSKTASLEEETKLIIEIASHYHQCTQSSSTALPPEPGFVIQLPAHELLRLFHHHDSNHWLSGLVTLWNQNHIGGMEPSLLFRDWSIKEQQSALDFFADAEFVNLANSIFFYKLYPDKLFNELIHPEKLVSVRMRLGLLHETIELLQRQLYSTALQHGLKPGIDFLFHGDELPQGIMIEVNQEFRVNIQLAVKSLKVKVTAENEQETIIERLHDLGRAYKFWFNPNRLIDAVMVLQQRLTSDCVDAAEQVSAFRQEMLLLYRQLTTTDCLNLYGYFANNDSRYLLYTLFTIVQGKPIDWLPELNMAEKKAVASVFQALQCVMEALRMELKNRHVTTEPYVYDLAKPYLQAGRRNRDAVFRIIAIYGRETVTVSDAIEKLFGFVEDS